MTDFELKLAIQKTLNETIKARMTIEALTAMRALPESQRSKAALQLSNLVLASRQITNLRIAEIRKELQENSQDLVVGIKQLKKALNKIDNAKKVIQSTADFLKVIAKLVVLL